MISNPLVDCRPYRDTLQEMDMCPHCDVSIYHCRKDRMDFRNACKASLTAKMQPHPTSFLSSSFRILPKVFQVFVKFPLLCCPARPCQVAWPCHLGIAVQSFPPCLPLEHISPVLRGLYPAYLSFWILYLLVFASPSPLFLELTLVIWSAPTVCFYNKHSPDHPRAENEKGAKSRNPQVLWMSQGHAYSSSFSWGNQGSVPSGDSSWYSTISWSDPQPHSQAEDTSFTFRLLVSRTQWCGVLALHQQDHSHAESVQVMSSLACFPKRGIQMANHPCSEHLAMFSHVHRWSRK